MIAYNPRDLNPTHHGVLFKLATRCTIEEHPSSDPEPSRIQEPSRWSLEISTARVQILPRTRLGHTVEPKLALEDVGNFGHTTAKATWSLEMSLHIHGSTLSRGSRLSQSMFLLYACMIRVCSERISPCRWEGVHIGRMYSYKEDHS